jgi:hypothetical protein
MDPKQGDSGICEEEDGANSRIWGSFSRSKRMAAANPAAATTRRRVPHNTAGAVFSALEHTPGSSSRQGTAQPSASAPGGFCKKTRYVDGVSTPVVRALSICTPFLLSFLDLLELVILFPLRVHDRSCHPCTGGSQEISLTMVLILNRNNTLEEKLYVFLLS